MDSRVCTNKKDHDEMLARVRQHCEELESVRAVTDPKKHAAALKSAMKLELRKRISAFSKTHKRALDKTISYAKRLGLNKSVEVSVKIGDGKTEEQTITPQTIKSLKDTIAQLLADIKLSTQALSKRLVGARAEIITFLDPKFISFLIEVFPRLRGTIIQKGVASLGVLTSLLFAYIKENRAECRLTTVPRGLDGFALEDIPAGIIRAPTKLADAFAGFFRDSTFNFSVKNKRTGDIKCIDLTRDHFRMIDVSRLRSFMTRRGVDVDRELERLDISRRDVESGLVAVKAMLPAKAANK